MRRAGLRVPVTETYEIIALVRTLELPLTQNHANRSPVGVISPLYDVVRDSNTPRVLSRAWICVLMVSSSFVNPVRRDSSASMLCLRSTSWPCAFLSKSRSEERRVGKEC